MLLGLDYWCLGQHDKWQRGDFIAGLNGVLQVSAVVRLPWSKHWKQSGWEGDKAAYTREVGVNMVVAVDKPY
jgi:N-acyl-L-homoserine lactone synthetase